MAALVQTIAVVDKSGKAVSTSKHLVNVFKEARAAYRERKAEVAAGRQHQHGSRESDHLLKDAQSTDARPKPSSRKTFRSHHDGKRHSSGGRSPASSMRSEPASPRRAHPPSHGRVSPAVHSPPPSPSNLKRTQSAHEDDMALVCAPPLPPRSMTSPSTPAIDMDLAYGDIPPPLPVAQQQDEQELRGLIATVKRLLEEADCLQYSASATIAMLQKNPEAMAAVALTLAEISNIAKKMAPGALVALKGSSPAVFALLASPQFLIAGGVAVGITIVAFGGYKIIKKIREKTATEQPGVDEMLVVDDVSRIDNWRRGISDADMETQSVGTSVEAELITPHAALSKMKLNENQDREGEKSQRTRKSSGSKVDSDMNSQTSSRAESKAKSKMRKEAKEKKVKKQKPSPLRMLMHG